MSRIQNIVAVGLFSLLAVALNAHAGPYYYANPAQVDLAKDLNATVAGGGSPDQINSYRPKSQDNFGPPVSSPSIYQVNLGSAQPVGVITFNKYDVAGFGASAWTIQRSVIGGADANWTDVASGDDSTPTLTGNAGGATAQYVRIRATAFAGNPNNIWVLQHVQVYGAANYQIPIRDTLNIGGAPSNNTVAVVSGPNGTGPNRTDGANINDMSPNDGTFGLNGGDGLGNANTLPRDITYTFDSAYNMKAIRWGTYESAGQIENYQVYASLFGGAETLVDTNTAAVPGYGFYDAFDGAFMSGIAADKLRIHVTSYFNGASNAYPAEIEVFGASLPEPTGASLILATLGMGMVRRRRGR